MKPRSAPLRGFPIAEYEARLDRAQQMMHRQGIAALWLTTEPEVRYFSGFLTQFWQSPTRPWFLVIPANGKPIAVIPEIGARYMADTWIDDIRTWPAPTPNDDGVTLLLATLREIIGRTGRIGALMGPETQMRLPLQDLDNIRDALVGDSLEIVDATPLIQALRMVKSTAEIEKIAYICDLVSEAFTELPNLVSIGDPEREIFRTFKIDILGRGADDIPYLVGGAGAAGYEDIISPPTARCMQPGDILILDTGSVFDGYFCDFDRNFAFGRPAETIQKAHALLYRATEAGFKAVRPGVTAAAVFQAMAQEIENWGSSGHAVGRLGHGLGMQLTEWPSLTASDQTVLRPGMVITLEPGLEIIPGRMLVHEENIVIRESGPELLTKRTPREMPVID